jgi:hypothetical protein
MSQARIDLKSDLKTGGISMKHMIIGLALASGLALSACTPEQGALTGGALGLGVAAATGANLGTAILLTGVGALAGAVYVNSQNGWCYYKYKGRIYRDRCR